MSSMVEYFTHFTPVDKQLVTTQALLKRECLFMGHPVALQMVLPGVGLVLAALPSYKVRETQQQSTIK